MNYLVDANVLSEATKPMPSDRAVDWLARREQEIAVDAIILGELRYGILLMDKGRRRQRLEIWFTQVVAKIRCVPWDAACGLRWAGLQAELRSGGNTMPLQDSMIAATALRYDLVVATRNSRDFQNAGVRLVNPFD
jgi:predicted nucleic acid-binding protein